MININFNQEEIIRTLDNLNILHEDTPNSRGYLNVICPFHDDKDFGNSGIDISTGVIHCFRCHTSKDIISLVREKMNFSFKEAVNFIKNKDIFNKKEKLNNVSCDFNLNNKENIKNKKINKKIKTIDDLILEKFNPEDFEYTRIRGFTKKFCNEFNIQKCISGWYKNYFIIPIFDTKKNISTFEARKLNKFEYLKSIGITEEQLEKTIEIKKLKIKDFKVYSRITEEYIDNSIFLFLLKPKVLYPSGSIINETLFNIDNLDFNKDLWASEGMGSIPKIYENISKNVTCTFGSEITDSQIEYLKKFNKRKIIIPDNDEASLIEIESLNMQVENLFVADIKSEDKDNSFITDLKNCNIISAFEYVAKERKLFDY